MHQGRPGIRAPWRLCSAVKRHDVPCTAAPHRDVQSSRSTGLDRTAGGLCSTIPVATALKIGPLALRHVERRQSTIGPSWPATSERSAPSQATCMAACGVPSRPTARESSVSCGSRSAIGRPVLRAEATCAGSVCNRPEHPCAWNPCPLRQVALRRPACF